MFHLDSQSSLPVNWLIGSGSIYYLDNVWLSFVTYQICLLYTFKYHVYEVLILPVKYRDEKKASQCVPCGWSHSDLFSTASASRAIKKYGLRSSREASLMRTQLVMVPVESKLLWNVSV